LGITKDKQYTSSISPEVMLPSTIGKDSVNIMIYALNKYDEFKKNQRKLLMLYRHSFDIEALPSLQ
jgi:hypothetical protein